MLQFFWEHIVIFYFAVSISATISILKVDNKILRVIIQISNVVQITVIYQTIPTQKNSF